MSRLTNRLTRRLGQSVVLPAAFTAALLTGAGAQNMPAGPGQAAAKPATGLIVGQLVDGSSGSPVSSATITLISTAPRPPGAAGPGGQPGFGPRPTPPLEVLTDGNGRFVFHSLVAGSYALSANRPGYLRAAYGQPPPSSAPVGPGGAGRSLELTEGQRLTNVTMKIWKYGSISGRLVDEAGEPAVGATLVVVRSIGAGAARRYTTGNSDTTDDRGIFRFADLSPGDYLVMMPTNVVSVPTSVVDAYLDGTATGPAGNQASRDLQASGGRASSVGRTIGDQLVSAFQGDGMPQLMLDATGKMSVYPVTFYPGVRPIALATVITLESGQERTGVDFAARPVPAASVKGRVMGPDGPAANLAVKLVPTDALIPFTFSPSDSGEIASAVTRSDGTFTALGVPAGDYTASVMKIPVAPRQMSQPSSVISVGGGTSSFGSSSQGPVPAPTEPLLWGRAAVSVGETNVEGVTIQLATGVTVAGRVEFEDGATTPVPAVDVLQRSRVSLSPVDGPAVMRSTPPSIGADGSFTTQGYVPGRYFLTISVAAPGWTMKSVLVGGRNVLNTAIDLTGPDLTGVVVTFTDKTGELSGTVASAASVTDIGVMVIPADYQSWIQSGMNPRAARAATARDGTYRVPGILAGDFIVVASSVATMQQAQQDAQTMMALAKQGIRLTLGEREKRTLSLTVVQVRQP